MLVDKIEKALAGPVKSLHELLASLEFGLGIKRHRHNEPVVFIGPLSPEPCLCPTAQLSGTLDTKDRNEVVRISPGVGDTPLFELEVGLERFERPVCFAPKSVPRPVGLHFGKGRFAH